MEKPLSMIPNETEPSLWKNKNIILLWSGSLISSFGYQFYIVALPLLIYHLTESPLAMSTMRAVEFVPNVILGVFAGIFVDRFNRKRIMTWMTIIQITVIASLVMMLIFKWIAIWQLFLFGFLLSSSSYTLGNAQHALVPTLVSKNFLTEVNARFSLISTLVNLIGPGMAGLILSLTTFHISFGLYGICLIALLCCIFSLSIESHEKKVKKTSLWDDFKEGWSELVLNKTLLPPTIAILFMNFASSLILGVYMFYAIDQLGTSESQVGILLSIGSIGGLVGAFFAPKIRKKIPRGRLFSYCILVDSIGMICMSIVPVWWLLGCCLLLRTLAVTITNIIYLSIRQEFTPNHLLGRVAGTSSMLMKLATPGALLLSGVLAGILPIKLLFVIAGILMIIIYLFIRKQAIVHIR